MRISLLKYILISMVFLPLMNCKRIEPASEELLPVVKFGDNVIITGINYDSRISNKLYFDITAVALKNGTTQNTLFSDTAFHDYHQTGPQLDVIIENREIGEYSNNNGYDVILLLDLTQPQFKSWTGPSFLNRVSKLITVCSDDPNKHIAIGVYARNVNDLESVLFCKSSKSGGIFDNDKYELIDFITRQYAKVGEFENSSMLDAISISVDELMELSSSEHRSIVLINGNDDDANGSITSSQLLQKCIDSNVSVNYINWDENYCGYVELALATGGFYAVANSISSLESSIYMTDEILSENYKFYKLNCMATKIGSWNTGNYLCAWIDVIDYEEIYSPYFEEDLYNDVEINKILPFYLEIP